MRLLVLSDQHLGPASPDRNQTFLRFLERALNSGDEVVIGGDLFDLWFGWDQLTFAYQKPILARMQELATAGLKMSYVEGNRDYGVRRLSGKIFQQVFEIGMRKEWKSHLIYLEHGDLINAQDRQYRLWRAASKNALTFWLLGQLPSALLLRMANRLESGMKQTNLEYRIHYPETQINDFYKRKSGEGNTIVIVGHFHEERELVLQHQNQSVLCYNLPGWEKGFRYLAIPELGKPAFEEIRG